MSLFKKEEYREVTPRTHLHKDIETYGEKETASKEVSEYKAQMKDKIKERRILAQARSGMEQEKESRKQARVERLRSFMRGVGEVRTALRGRQERITKGRAPKAVRSVHNRQAFTQQMVRSPFDMGGGAGIQVGGTGRGLDMGAARPLQYGQSRNAFQVGGGSRNVFAVGAREKPHKPKQKMILIRL